MRNGNNNRWGWIGKGIYISCLAFLCMLSFNPFRLMAQSVPVNASNIEEYLRRQQLLGKLDSSVSFMVRPIDPTKVFDGGWGIDNAALFKGENLIEENWFFQKGEEQFLTLPMTLRTRFNSNVAFGANDGALIPNSGFQFALSGGVFYKHQNLSIQIQPELIWAQNKDYQGFPLEHDGSTWLVYYEWLNTIDMPERFGNGSYYKLLPGQSSIRYAINEISFGISTENLWWGPGRRHALIMSNNAPGFLHATINTQRPIATSIGSFEGQLIAGRLENSGFNPPHSDYVYRVFRPYVPKRDRDWRYLAGLVLTYQPKWVPGFSIGYSSVSQMYHNDMNSLADYLPVFNGGKRLASIHDPAVANRNQLSAGFFRWMEPSGRFEFYGEYGSNGNSRTLNDFITNPDLTRAYTLGFMNLVPLKKQGQYLQLGGEITQTGQTVRETIRKNNSWYTHPHVRHGYTHFGQGMGAGYGPGSNVISIEGAWVNEFNKVGLLIERIVYNNDFYYKRFEDMKDWRVKYVDVTPTLMADWKFGNVLLSSRLQYVHSFNYKWFIVNQPDLYWVPGFDKNSFVGQVMLTYSFQ